MARRGRTSGNLTTVIEREGTLYVARCLEFDVASQGVSVREAKLQPPPADLVFELGAMIATHRWCALSNALEIAGWIFQNGSGEHRDLLRSPCLQGLAFLRQVLAFQEDPNPRPFTELPEVVSEDDVDLPWLRWRCVGLAAAMDLAGLGEESAVAGWLKDAENDPLPELRFAAEEWRSRRTTEGESGHE